MKYEDGSYYHVFNRGARRGPIFFNRGNYPYLLSLFKKYERESGVFLAAYCLMPNHYHLVIRQDAGGSISKFVQVVFNAYTQAVNLQQGLSGTLFQGKAKARYLDTDEYVLRVIRYVHLNPVRGGLVDQPEDWEFSDCREWISTSPLDRAKADFRKMYFFSGDDYRVFLRGVDEQIDMGRLSRYLFTEGSEGTSRGLLE
ncbi:MAG: transposase, partial [Bacteroidota bacterium]